MVCSRTDRGQSSTLMVRCTKVVFKMIIVVGMEHIALSMEQAMGGNGYVVFPMGLESKCRAIPYRLTDNSPPSIGRPSQSLTLFHCCFCIWYIRDFTIKDVLHCS